MASPTMLAERATQKEPKRGQRVNSFKVTQFVWLFLGLLETLIGLRIWFKLIVADPKSLIIQFVYRFTSPFVNPLAGLRGTPAVNGLGVESWSIIAMFVYALLAWELERIIWVAFYRPRENVEGVTKQ